MSGETEKQVSAWQTDTLKEFLLALIQQVRVELTGLITAAEKRLDASIAAASKAAQERFESQQQGVKDALTAQKEATASALLSAEKAVLVAENNAEKWRMNANEWRGSMLDRETKFASRVEVEAELKGIRTEIQSLREARAQGTGEKGGRLSQQQLLFAMFGLVGTLILIGGTVIGIAYAIRN